MFTKKKKEFIDISDITKTKRVETLKKAKHKEEVFSQLSDVRKGKRVAKKPRRAVISGLRKFKTEQPRFDVVSDRKKQTFGKLSLLGKMKGMSAEEKKKE